MNVDNENNEPMVDLCALHSDVEAAGMASLFDEEGIGVLIFKRQDTAGPGVFDRDAPWGVARVSASDLDRAKALWAEWRDAGPPEIGDAWRVETSSRDQAVNEQRRGATGWFFFVVGFAAGCAAMYLYLM